jgi:hypothetical protein
VAMRPPHFVQSLVKVFWGQAAARTIEIAPVPQLGSRFVTPVEGLESLRMDSLDRHSGRPQGAHAVWPSVGAHWPYLWSKPGAAVPD